MKIIVTLTVLLSICVIDFTGCRKKDDNPIGVTDSTIVGKSALSGRVVSPPNGYINYSDSGDCSGIKIQLLNTLLQTESDKNGHWKIQNLDSGTYTIQFTKPGYDTVIIPNLLLKNKDSMYIGRIGVSGEKWGDVVLNEQITGTIINPSAQIVATVLREYKDPKDTTKVVYREMGYDFSALLGIEVRGLTLKTWDQLVLYNNTSIYEIGYCITNTPTIDLSSFPTSTNGNGVITSFASTRRWKFLDLEETKNISKMGIYSLPMFNDENITTIAERYKFDLSNKEQLYLHIIPFWKQLAHKNYGITNYENWKRGEVVSIPIQWK